MQPSHAHALHLDTQLHPLQNSDPDDSDASYLLSCNCKDADGNASYTPENLKNFEVWVLNFAENFIIYSTILIFTFYILKALKEYFYKR